MTGGGLKMEPMSLREITEDNFDAVIGMERPADDLYVASNSYFARSGVAISE